MGKAGMDVNKLRNEMIVFTEYLKLMKRLGVNRKHLIFTL